MGLPKKQQGVISRQLGIYLLQIAVGCACIAGIIYTPASLHAIHQATENMIPLTFFTSTNTYTSTTPCPCIVDNTFQNQTEDASDIAQDWDTASSQQGILLQAWDGANTTSDKDLQSSIQSMQHSLSSANHFFLLPVINSNALSSSSDIQIITNIRTLLAMDTYGTIFFHWQGNTVLSFENTAVSHHNWNAVRQQIDPQHHMLWYTTTTANNAPQIFDTPSIFQQATNGVVYIASQQSALSGNWNGTGIPDPSDNNGNIHPVITCLQAVMTLHECLSFHSIQYFNT